MFKADRYGGDSLEKDSLVAADSDSLRNVSVRG